MEGFVLWRSARPWLGRGRILYPQEDGDVALFFGGGDWEILRRAGGQALGRMLCGDGALPRQGGAKPPLHTNPYGCGEDARLRKAPPPPRPRDLSPFPPTRPRGRTAAVPPRT